MQVLTKKPFFVKSIICRIPCDFFLASPLKKRIWVKNLHSFAEQGMEILLRMGYGARLISPMKIISFVSLSLIIYENGFESVKLYVISGIKAVVSIPIPVTAPLFRARLHQYMSCALLRLFLRFLGQTWVPNHLNP